MRDEIIRRGSTLQLESRFFGFVVVLTPKHLKEAVSSNADKRRLVRIGMIWSHGWHARVLECVISRLCAFDSGGICGIELAFG